MVLNVRNAMCRSVRLSRSVTLCMSGLRYVSSDVVRILKLTKICIKACSTHGTDDKCAEKVGKPDGKRLLGGHRRRCQKNDDWIL